MPNTAGMKRFCGLWKVWLLLLPGLGLAVLSGTASAQQELVDCFEPPEQFREDYGDYRSPLVFNDGRRVRHASDWPQRREEIRLQWQELLGEWPAVITQPEVEVVATATRGELVQHTVRFRWTPQERTTGYLLLPPGTGRRPAVLVVYYEPETAIGLGKPHRDFALRLARRGFVTLSIGTTAATAAKNLCPLLAVDRQCSGAAAVNARLRGRQCVPRAGGAA